MISTGEPDLSFQGTGQQENSPYTWTAYYTNSAPNECPVFNCRIYAISAPTESLATFYGKYGIKYEHLYADSPIIYDDTSCSECTYTNNDNDFYEMYCFTYYDASSGTPDSTGL